MAQTHSIDRPRLTPPDHAFVELKLFLRSELPAVSPFIDHVMRFVARFRIKDGNKDEIEVALREALLNAIIHGNRQDPGKAVFVAIRCSTDGKISLMVRDEGEGFDPSVVPDPTATENLMSTSGRRIYLMRALMDEVWFEKDGTVVQMLKHAANS